jgi:excisionase family DNA binding protein
MRDNRGRSKRTTSEQTGAGGRRNGIAYTVQQAAELLNISPAGVRALIRRRALPAVQLGARWTRIRDVDIQDCLRRHMLPGTLETA